MKIQVGMPFIEQVKTLEGVKLLRFMVGDDRCIFEVSIESEKSICIRAVDVTKIDGALYDTCLQVSPRASNTIVISTREYSKGGI